MIIGNIRTINLGSNWSNYTENLRCELELTSALLLLSPDRKHMTDDCHFTANVYGIKSSRRVCTFSP